MKAKEENKINIFPWFKICNRCPAIKITSKGYECSKIKLKSRKGYKKLSKERNYKTGEILLRRPGTYFTKGRCIKENNTDTTKFLAFLDHVKKRSKESKIKIGIP
ncbi:MAG: hypothetical protein ACYS1A_17825 [Planctomycetota bacterium]|jgi:ribosomal protein L27